jgi:hypothetical protein
MLLGVERGADRLATGRKADSPLPLAISTPRFLRLREGRTACIAPGSNSTSLCTLRHPPSARRAGRRQSGKP